MTKLPTYRALAAAIAGLTLALSSATPVSATAATPTQSSVSAGTAQASAPRAAPIRTADAVRADDGSYTLTWRAVPGVGSVEIYAATDPRQRGQHITTSSDDRAVISGLDSAQRWYFELVPEGRDRGFPIATRSLDLAGLPNARDVGGYRTRDGRIVTWGSVLRTDTLSKATDTDIDRLGRLGLSQVVDFRSPAEIHREGQSRIPDGSAYTPRPIYDPEDDFFVKVSRLIGSGDPDLQHEALADGRAEQLMIEENRFYATDADTRAHIGAVLRDLATSDEALLYHCTAGKDRTGWMTAVLLTTLGVDRETVLGDYLLSNEYRATVNEKTMAVLAERGHMRDPELLRPILEVRGEYLRAAFDEVETRYGSFARYLRHGLGVDPATQRELRQRLLVR